MPKNFRVLVGSVPGFSDYVVEVFYADGVGHVVQGDSIDFASKAEVGGGGSGEVEGDTEGDAQRVAKTDSEPQEESCCPLEEACVCVGWGFCCSGNGEDVGEGFALVEEGEGVDGEGGDEASQVADEAGEEEDDGVEEDEVEGAGEEVGERPGG